VIFAHQGGWDEMLFVLVPIAVIVWLLWLAEKRATARNQARYEDNDPESMPEGPPDGD
jgi:hypothetical protein